MIVQHVENQDKNRPAKSNLQEHIIKQVKKRTVKDLNEWKDAEEIAKNPRRPERSLLVDYFDVLSNDGHISGVVESIKNKIKSRKFKIVDENGDEDEEATAIFETEWFFDFIDSVIDAEFYGYSLLQFTGVQNNTLTGVENIDRRYIIPEWKMMKKYAYGNRGETGIFFEEDKRYKNWTLFVNANNLGLYNKSAPHAIAKKHFLSLALENAELFGIPIRIGRTDTSDPKNVNWMENMLDNMGSSAWAVLDETQNIELTERGDNDVYNLFLEPMKYSNLEISKAFAGQTMVFEDGSSYSQSKVHENLFEEFVGKYMRSIRFVANNKLIPKLQNLGITGLDNKKFKWHVEEHLSIPEKTKVIFQLAKYYRIPAEFVQQYIGIEAEDRQAPEPDNYKSVMDEINKQYKGGNYNNGNHVVVLREPEQFKRIKQLWNKERIKAYGGQLKDGTNQYFEQSLEFKKQEWTVADVEDYLKKRKINYLRLIKAL